MNIKLDSRKVKKGDTFVAIRGINKDGHNYIDSAIKNGASKIIAEEGNYDVETLIVKDTKRYLANYLKEEYKEVLNSMKFIGITGTNGKTTSSFLTYQLLNKLGTKTAYIGTIGFYIDNNFKELDNTTPEITDLYEMFIDCYKNNVKVIVMEVSSQAIDYGRVIGIEFDIAVFTNLTQDHLDYHITMDNYMNAKLELFKSLKNEKLAIINEDDPHYQNFILNNNNNILYGEKSQNYKIESCKLDMTHSLFTINVDAKKYDIKLPLAGKFNVHNYMNAFIIARHLKYDINSIIEKTRELKSPDGRYDIYKYNNGTIIIDFAHTPDALENILNSVNEYKQAKVYTIVGCGGDRDRKKRPIMGKISVSNSDYVIFTNDNPRFEDQNQIMNDIVRNLRETNYEIIFDRKQAIEKGMSLIKDKDVLLVLGKGHEPYQVIGDIKEHFSDKEEVLKIIDKK